MRAEQEAEIQRNMAYAKAHLNGQSGPAAPAAILGTHPMRIVEHPTMEIIMSGHIRMQIPASSEAQMIYDLMAPDMKLTPDKHAFIAQEAADKGKMAIEFIGGTLRQSPGLVPMNNKLTPSIATIDGKLFYVFLLPVRSA